MSSKQLNTNWRVQGGTSGKKIRKANTDHIRKKQCTGIWTLFKRNDWSMKCFNGGGGGRENNRSYLS